MISEWLLINLLCYYMDWPIPQKYPFWIVRSRIFRFWMPFLSPDYDCDSTEGTTSAEDVKLLLAL